MPVKPGAVGWYLRKHASQIANCSSVFSTGISSSIPLYSPTQKTDLKNTFKEQDGDSIGAIFKNYIIHTHTPSTHIHNQHNIYKTDFLLLGLAVFYSLMIIGHKDK